MKKTKKEFFWGFLAAVIIVGAIAFTMLLLFLILL